jgi:NTP pyrophosphatase (non-canonical NTP hydrolase)
MTPPSERVGLSVLANVLTFDKYQELADTTAIYPEHGTRSLRAIEYCALGLASEAGEVAGKVKKLMRDGDSDEKRLAIVKEIGDCFWYIAQALRELGDIGMGDAALLNIKKLDGRAQRGTLQGNGDER